MFAVEVAEVQRVGQRDGVGTHREGVANDAADTGGRAVVGVHERRVVVALDTHRDVRAVRDFHDCGVVARTDDDLLALRIEGRQERSGRPVRAVFAPEVLEQRRLRRGRVPVEFGDDEFAVWFGETHSPVCTDTAN